MSNKAHLRPHRKKRQVRRTTGLLVVILLAALVALVTAMAASGHAMPPGRIIPLRGGRRTVGGRLQFGLRFDTVRCRLGRTDKERWSSLNRFGQLRPELLVRLRLGVGSHAGSHHNEQPRGRSGLTWTTRRGPTEVTDRSEQVRMLVQESTDLKVGGPVRSEREPGGE